MAIRLRRLLLPLIAATLASACASGPTPSFDGPGQAPWWETAGPCRVWVPIQPTPGAGLPAWDPGPSTTRMSRPGDCRSLQANLPDGAVLIGSP